MKLEKDEGEAANIEFMVKKNINEKYLQTPNAVIIADAKNQICMPPQNLCQCHIDTIEDACS